MLRFLSVNEENRFSANLGIVGVCLLRLIMADFLGELLDKIFLNYMTNKLEHGARWWYQNYGRQRSFEECMGQMATLIDSNSNCGHLIAEKFEVH